MKNELLYMSDISKTTINLPKDLKKELKKIAIDEETSLSGLIIKMIEEGMKNRNKTDVISDED
ncbi:MAG: Met repressor [Methanobrevibacter sp.]|nr:Met repressor [Methanobrevibacter sp.]MEE3490459.1 Met repressor [Methanobrevibacter sp.]